MNADEQHFLSVVRPGLASGDATTLADTVKQTWAVEDVVGWLDSPNVDVRRAAALVIGLIGNRRYVGQLARRLHDEDEQVHQMAEHALWSIWFRVCDRRAAETFSRGSDLLAEESYDQAAECFTRTIELYPEFAEAYNQRAIAHFFAGRYEQAAEDCRRALKLMPSHFGAASGLGHSLCHMGDLTGAMEAYRKALAINPRMPGIRSAIQRIEAKMAKPVPKDSSKVSGRYSSN